MSPIVQCEQLVPLSGFTPLFILALNKVPLVLDVVVRIVCVITGKEEKNGSRVQHRKNTVKGFMSLVISAF